MIKIDYSCDYPLVKGTEESAAYDLKATGFKAWVNGEMQEYSTTEFILLPSCRVLVTTSLYLYMPRNYEAQVRPRSGLALKHGITVLNTPGTIDSDYPNEIGVILTNLSTEDYHIKLGDKVAQILFKELPIIQPNKIELEMLQTLHKQYKATRDGGFGSTGV